jgi:hypothetical protein
MKDSHNVSRLLVNVIADKIYEPSKFFEHVEHALEPVYEENDGEAPRRRKRQMTAKSFGDDFTIYLMDEIPKIVS